MTMGPYYRGSSDSVGLYGSSSTFGGTYFEWFVFQVSNSQPTTPTDGSWSFTTNSGTPPTGWSSDPPANPSALVWVSIANVNSRNTNALVWSAPGQFAFSSGAGLAILTGTGTPNPGDGANNQLYFQTDTAPQTIWLKESGTWTRITGSTLYADLVSNQSIGGTKTFTSQIAGSVSGTSANVTGIVAVGNGGTGATTSTGFGSVVLSTSPTLVTPVLGTPASGNFSTGTFTWPTFNQNTTGTAATATTATNVTGGTASVTTLTTSSTVTLNGGTANGVAYLNGSKVLTTGTALMFDGTSLGLGVTPSAWSGYKGFDLATNASIGSYLTNITLNSNAYFGGSGWTYKSTSFAGQYLISGNTHSWSTAPSGTAGSAITLTQAMTLDGNGRLVVGGTTASGRLTVTSGSAYDGNFYLLSQFTNTVGATEKGVLLGYNNSDNSGIIAAGYASGSGALAFWTKNGSAWGERARIDTSGNLLVGTQSQLANGKFGVYNSSTGNGIEAGIIGSDIAYSVYTARVDNTANLLHTFFYGNYSTVVGSITTNGTITVYNTTSDYRLKNNQAPLTGSGAFIDALKPKTWDWAQDGSKGVGFIAHEFAEVSPNSVSGKKDSVDADEKPIYQAMQASSAEVIANLVAEIQSLRKRLAALEAK